MSPSQFDGGATATDANEMPFVFVTDAATNNQHVLQVTVADAESQTDIVPLASTSPTNKLVGRFLDGPNVQWNRISQRVSRVNRVHSYGVKKIPFP